MDRQIAHPDVKTPIKTWYKGHYEHAFLALYPFYRIISANPMRSQDAPYERILRWDERPDDFGEIMKLRGETIRWSEVHETVAPEISKNDFYLAVWLSAGLGYAERANIALQQKIADFCEAENIYLPEEDFIPAILHPAVGRFLAPFENQRIVAYNEFRDHSVELSLSCFQEQAPTAFLPQATTSNDIWAIHVPDPGILITSADEGTEALIAMTDAAFRQSDPREFFETETVTEGMYYDWLNPIDFFARNG
ncbi:MAG: hypothetical protein ABJN14_01535 [Paracoccaceae bacterium]